MGSLTPISMTDPEYNSIISHFDLSPSSYTTIHSILKIEMEYHFANRFDSIVMWAWKKPVIRRLFHGTRHACDVWKLNDWSKLCDNVECGICGILKSGPLLKMAKPNFAGKYLWYSPTASMINKYTGPLKPYDDGFRAMFIMDVVYGKHYLKSIITDSDENVLPRYLIIYKGRCEQSENPGDILS